MNNDLKPAFAHRAARPFTILAICAPLFLAACDDDPRADALQADLTQLEAAPASGIVELSAGMRECIMEAEVEQPDGSMEPLGDINVLSKQNNAKFLFLVRYPELKEIEKDTQDAFFDFISYCASEFGIVDNPIYIAVTGEYVVGLVKTPETEQVGLSSDETALYAFYDGLTPN